MKRRDFLRAAGSLVPLCVLDPASLMKAFAATPADRLSLRANRGTQLEGTWQILDIEGLVPPELTGELIRIGPGQKNNFGVALKHFFDGDPYLARFAFSNSKVILKAQFLETPERSLEKKQKKMLFHEFGTVAPGKAEGFKFQPNVHVMSWGDDLLALSESGHPFLLSQGQYFDFKGTLPKNVSFTAHPKQDPISKNIYGYGVKKSLGLDLKIYRIDPTTQKAKELYSISQKKAFVIHDMMLTENHIVFLMPPLYLHLLSMIRSKPPLAEALRFEPELGAKILILRKDGQGEPIEIELPSLMAFHHGNAYEDQGQIVFDSFVAKDHSILELMANWQKPAQSVSAPGLVRFKVELAQRKLVSQTALLANCDFPAIDINRMGQPQRYLYMARQNDPNDPLSSQQISKFDFSSGDVLSTPAIASEVCGEPVFVSRPGGVEDDGWCVYMGYNSQRDETFVQVIDAHTFAPACRIWAGRYLPLGFHGFFRKSFL